MINQGASLGEYKRVLASTGIAGITGIFVCLCILYEWI